MSRRFRKRRAGTRGAKGPRVFPAFSEWAEWSERLADAGPDPSAPAAGRGGVEGRFLRELAATRPRAVRLDPGSFAVGEGAHVRPSALVLPREGGIQFHFASGDRKSDPDEWGAFARLYPFWTAVRWTPSKGFRTLPPGEHRKSRPGPTGRATGPPPYSPFELEFAGRLDDLVARGDLLGYRFEPAAFRLAWRCGYSPDFMLVYPGGRVGWAEVKGPKPQEDSIVKMKAFASTYPWWEVLYARKAPDDDRRMQWRCEPVERDPVVPDLTW